MGTMEVDVPPSYRPIASSIAPAARNHAHATDAIGDRGNARAHPSPQAMPTRHARGAVPRA